MSVRIGLSVGALAVALVFAAAPARADQLDLASRGDAEIIAAVTLVDKLSAMCARTGGMDTQTRAALSSWNTANHVDLVRGEIRRLSSAPATRRAMQAVDAQAETLLADKRGQSCQGVRSLVGLPSASFAARAARLGASSADARVVTPAAASRSSQAPAAAPAPNIRAIASQIEGFAFDTRAGIGLGGMVSLVVYPVVLFKNGQVLTDVEGLGFAGGVEAHRRANPDDWSQWRRAGGRVQTMEKGAWADLPFTAVYQRVPAGFTLEGRYQRTGGAGNIAMGGTDAVTTWETYDFFPGGRVIKGGGAGAQATGGDFSTVSRSVAPNRRGRYAIDGLTLVLTYDDGSTESAIFVTDPQDPKVVWLNGRDFRKIRPR